MPLNKQPVAINFAQGVNQKVDPFQLPIGQFKSLTNSIFDIAGRLTKRNGYNTSIAALPNANQTTLTTQNGNLIATGTDLYSYNTDLNQWFDQGVIQPVSIDTLPLVRNSNSQSIQDSVTASNGLVCTVYKDTSRRYTISDSTTGQTITSGIISGSSVTDLRVVATNTRFVIFFVTTGFSLQYRAISIYNPTVISTAATLTADVNHTNTGYDASVGNNQIYVAYSSQASAAIKVLYLDANLVASTAVTQAGNNADKVSVYADTSTNVLWVTYLQVSGGVAKTIAFDLTLTQIMAATTSAITASNYTHVTTAPIGRTLYIYVDYTGAPISNVVRGEISVDYVTLPATGIGTGTGSPSSTELSSVLLASKAFVDNGNVYVWAVFGDNAQVNTAYNSNQSTYFLLDSNLKIYARLACENAGGYNLTQVLPSISSYNSRYQMSYLLADAITPTNTGTNLPSGTPVNAIYSSYGINLASFTINDSPQYSSEIAGALHLTGGQLWEYDGASVVEHNFHVYPDDIKVSLNASSGGSVGAGTYFYIVIYTWTDNQGNIHRSAPSIPQSITVTGSTNIVNISYPNLYLTAKSNVKIEIYRWSAAQPLYYKVLTASNNTGTSTSNSSLNDTVADSAILGNQVLYTSGAVVENIAAPPSIASALFNNRLWLVDAEDRNLLWYSKQVIANTPVEMSDLLTIYVAPTTGAQGSTGPVTAISAMDDKLIIFKKDAIYYISGTGPTNTGTESTYSDPVFITGTVGCANPKSIVLMQNGLMFQSDKGIWLLSRGLETAYIGAPVDTLALDNTVLSAHAIPATNQVRFVLDNSQTLMFDYFYNQWAVHTNVGAISSTIYDGVDTYLNSYGQIYKETPNYWLDGSTPVLMSLTTSWINVAGVQGYERFYSANLLGTYYTPFKLNCQIAYDYNSSAIQQTLILPDNYSANWGDESVWGSGGPWGGPGNVFSARIFPQKQKCESFQITLNEVYDPSYNVNAGQGLSLSGLLLLVGVKRGSRTQSARKSFG